jgi:hypothetical protein
MPLEQNQIIQKIEKIIDRYNLWKDDPTSADPWEIHTLLLETIWQLSPENSTFRRNAKHIVDRPLDHYHSYSLRSTFCDKDKLFEDIDDLFSVLSGLKTAYEDNLLISVKQRIHADIFKDFIEIADNFLQESEKLKCPAAVMLGSVLESHIKKLCENNDIETTYMKAEKIKSRHFHDMNVDLTKKGIFNNLIQRQNDFWYGIRSEAAHGKEENYSKQQVEDMLSGIRRLIIDYPA